MSERVVAVAVPLPVQSPFSYRVPGALPLPQRGARVLVPFAGRRVIGVVTGSGAARGAGERLLDLKDVVEVIDETPLLPPPLLDLADWMADYYLAPPGECHRLMLPPAGLRASRAVARLLDPGRARDGDPVAAALSDGPLRVSTLASRLGRDPWARLKRLREAGVVAIDQEIEHPSFKLVQVAVLVDAGAAPRGRAQAEAIDRLRNAGGRARVVDLVSEKPHLRAALRRLGELGVVRLAEEREERRPLGLPEAQMPELIPTPDQERVLAPLVEAVEHGGFRSFLLHGITGSGKTEVYFRCAERALRAGRGALLLVPEIALTPMLVRTAQARFGPTVSVLHSELSLGERHDQWWRVREGEARIVIGARSALFAPVEDLGVVVVDEEHEGAYKQDESPRYHARDAAVMRGRLEGATVVLGSATPSLESHANAVAGKYTRLSLPSRISPRGLPEVEVVDRREVLKAGGNEVLSPALLEAIRGRLQRQEQVLLLLNRRGWATSLLCRECGHQAACPNCSVSLTVHRRGQTTECHYCGYLTRAASACPLCKGEYLRLAGYGTEQVVEVVKNALPEARLGRLDRDVARRRGALARTLADFEAGRIDVLVGTQMIAKGHDFPNVTLVGVIDADVGLGLPDFRSAERTFQLLTQVAGRAGRGARQGQVVLQSHLPDHYALRLACAQDHAAFFEREMEFRRTMGYPPESALVNVVVRGRDAGRAAREADAIAKGLRALAPGRFRVLGPASAPLARLRQEHRFQLLLKGGRGAMREAVRRVLVERYGAVRWPGVAVDVDPVSVM
ncbi:MAG TPA: primosomal protein N' [Vicinamibacteria bacterium]|nr:primosomal protein N' [Vicinamibacteria bacterium]